MRNILLIFLKLNNIIVVKLNNIIVVVGRELSNFCLVLLVKWHFDWSLWIFFQMNMIISHVYGDFHAYIGIRSIVIAIYSICSIYGKKTMSIYMEQINNNCYNYWYYHYISTKITIHMANDLVCMKWKW